MAGKKDGSLKSFVAGAVAGTVDTCITMPLDTVKTNLQINSKLGLVSCARDIGKYAHIAVYCTPRTARR